MSEYIGPSPTDLKIDNQSKYLETSTTTPIILSPKNKLTPEELTQNRMQKLEEIASSRDFDIAELSTALNIQKFLETEDSKPKKNWQKYFTTIDDWKLYFKLNPDWEGLNTGQITAVESGSGFYRALTIWTKNQVKDLPEEEQKSRRKELIEQLFPPQQKDWSKFDTIEKWQEYMVQQGWQGLSTSQINTTVESGTGFYRALTIWTKNQVKDLPKQEQEFKRKELFEHIFPPQRKDWSKFDTIEKWQEYMVQQGWQGLRIKQIITTVEGGNGFYQAFRTWTKNEIKDLPKQEQELRKRELIEQLFPLKRNKLKKEESVQDPSEKINWHTGFTTEIVDITSEITPVDSTNKNKLPKAGVITPAQVLRFFSGREKFVPELYAQHIEELATYAIHRGAIDFLINYFNRTEQSFPQTIADFGSGPSTAYSAYKELWPIIKQEIGILTPPIIQDFDNSQEMLNLGQNSKKNKHLVDVTKEKIPFENSQVDMVQSTFMIHHFKPNEILQTLVEANRITKNGGHLLLFSIYPFTDSFLSGVEQLGYQVITQQGEILVPNEETLKQVSQNSSPEAAKKLQSHFNNSFILFAQKIDNAHNTPSLESFIFNQRQRKTKRINSTQDFKESDINPKTLETSIDKLIFFINYEIQNLISQTNEYELPKSGNEIMDGYYIFNDRLKLFQEKYQLIQQFRKNGKYIFTQKETQKLVVLREKIYTARKTKTNYHQNHHLF